MVDLRGRTVLPGLIDAHTHPIPQYKLGHRMHQVPLSSSVVQSFEDLTRALKRQVERRPAGDWILGFGYEDTVLGRHPTRGRSRSDFSDPSDLHYAFEWTSCRSE